MKKEYKYSPKTWEADEYGKAEHAAELHQRGCNCAQAVACTFCKEFGISEDDMFRIAEGFGLGMGVMEMCGALSGMAIQAASCKFM